MSCSFLDKIFMINSKEWLGINGGFSEDYVDHLGRRWHHTKEKWTPTGWGGYVAFKPRDYTNTAYLILSLLGVCGLPL